MNLSRLFLSGLLGRCPRCGAGALFEGFLTVRAACPRCGADLRAAESGDGPVVIILLLVGAIGCGGLLYSELALHSPIWLQLLIWIPVTGGLAVLALRPLKGVMIALQLGFNASEAKSGAPPPPPDGE